MTPTVYCHDVCSAYPPEELRDLPGVPVYAGRALGATMSQDIIVLPQQTEVHYPWIQDHYDRVGLPVARHVVFGGREVIRRHLDCDMSVFYFGAPEHEVRPNQRWRDTAEFLNSKNNFMALCQQLGVATPRTLCVEDLGPHDINPVNFGGIFPVYVKKAVSASGFGVWRCNNMEQFLALIRGLRVPFQIQEALPEGTEFLNVQYEVGPRGDPLPDLITSQLLEGNSHSGNVFPTLHDEVSIYQATDPLANWAVKSGIQGVFAFDVAVTPDGRVLPIECNPRWNGASYPTRVARKLGLKQWRSKNVAVKELSFDGFEFPDSLAYNSRNKEGIIVVNWGCVSEPDPETGKGKLGILVAGDPSTQHELIIEFEGHFS